MLTGFYPATGQKTGQDQDQMDPIHADLAEFRLLKEVLPFHHLTTATGLSSLLVFMGTGQGSWTLTSLPHEYTATRQDAFHLS
jgi:hypothetical protein